MILSSKTVSNVFNEINAHRSYGSERRAMEFVQKQQLEDVTLWPDFVDVFRRHYDDKDDGWRGEYWGKMMRGACLTYLNTHSYELYRILTNSVYDIIGTQDSLGRISSYSISNEFRGWDIWCRKYVMLGMEYYIDICKDKKFIKIITDSLQNQADYIISKIGDGDNKTDIFDTSDWWGAMNSCSILEVFVRLFNLTQKKKYLDFAEYIINKGFCRQLNLIDACLAKTYYPYQFPYTKAYEMMSCFEGLLEYYRIKKVDKFLLAVENFVDMVKETDLSIIGCSGCTHELFDNSAVKQTEPAPEFIMQETCVTVTWMKLCYNLLKLTGKAKYAKLIEQSAYNALLGSVNRNLNDLVFCQNQTPDFNKGVKYIFDSYSPLYYDRRGKKIGGHKDYKDGYYYGCCNCIGSAGLAILNDFAAMNTNDGIVINSFIRQRIKTDSLEIAISGSLAKNGKCRISVISAQENILQHILIMQPDWADNFSVRLNGQPVNNNIINGYLDIAKAWSPDDQIIVSATIPVKKVVLNNKIAFTKGQYVLARDENIDEYFSEPLDVDMKLVKSKKILQIPAELCYEGITKNNHKIIFIDYASAGQFYDEQNCKITVWSKIAE